MRRRSIYAALASSVAFLALPVLAGPAFACACGSADVDEELAEGNAVAIVTRIDDGATENAVFAVEQSWGAPLPPRLTGTVDFCHVEIGTHEVAALVFRRKSGWVMPDCAEADLTSTLTRFQGEPRAVAGGPPIAVAVVDDRFITHDNYIAYDNRLVALDAQARPVAWSDRVIGPIEIAVCPGGSRIVTNGTAPKPPDRSTGTKAVPSIAVYDTATLKLLREVSLGRGNGAVRAMRCVDPDATTIQLVHSKIAKGPDPLGLATVEGSKVRFAALPSGWAGAAVSPTGIRIRQGSKTFVIDDEGRRRPLKSLARRGSDESALSPDGRTEALLEQPTFDDNFAVTAPGRLVTYDIRTGKRLGEWSVADFVGGLQWTDSGNVLVRTGAWGARFRAFDPGTIVIFDRKLSARREYPGVAGGLTPVGDGLAYWGGSRLSIAGPSGDPRAVQNPRLAAITSLVSLSRSGFRVPGSGVVAQPPVVRAVPPGTPTTDGAASGLAAVLALGAVTAAAVALWRRRFSAAA